MRGRTPTDRGDVGGQQPEELIDDVRGYLWSTQKQPDVVKAFFNESHVCYAAA